MLLCFWILLAGFFLFSAEAFNPFQPLRVLPDNAKEENHSTSQIFSLVHREDGGFGVAAPMKLGIKRRTRSVSISKRALNPDLIPPLQSQIDQRLGNAIGISVPAPKLPRHSIGETQKPSILRSRKGVKRSNEYDIVTANEPEQTDSIAIDQDGTDFSYCSAVEFGSSGKSMYMLIDTGTADTWVMGADCSSEPCSNHSIFGPQDSNTLHTTTTKFNLTYGTGTVSGVVINDTVKMAGFSIPLSFGLASIVSDDFKWYPIDGILGLGRTSPDAGRFPTVMEAIKTNNLLQKNILGIYLQRIKDGNTNGELNFGSPDTTKYTGGLSYTNTVSDKKRWEIPIDDANVNGVACNFSGKSAIIDTGTTFVILPPVDAQRFHSLIPGSQQTGESFIIPCSSSLPVQIIITSIVYNISAKDYVGSPIADKNMCLSNIVGKPTFGPDKWLLGDVFLKNVYTVLDFDENRIG